MAGAGKRSAQLALSEPQARLKIRCLRWGRKGLSARPRGELVELHVEDEGPGFPPEFIADAFDRFSRSLDARSGGGSGLGLSIVELIARAHGGGVGAQNRGDGGADVWIAVGRAENS